jgi:hypothetical protein
MVELKGLLKVYSKFRGEDSDSLANVIQLLAECALILLTRYHRTVFHSIAQCVHCQKFIIFSSFLLHCRLCEEACPKFAPFLKKT